MKRWPARLVWALLLGGAAWAGCSSDHRLFLPMDSGGSSASSTTSSRGAPASGVATASSGDSSNTCAGVSNGICEPLLGEDCRCTDCSDTAACKSICGAPDGVCDPLEDACTCPDCFTFHACSDPTRKNCKDDGKCDPLHEGCACADCKTHPVCEDAIAQCLGAALDHICDISEPCGCPDCFGVWRCLPCTVDGTCAPEEPCSCADCSGTPYCKDPANCQDDGICDVIIEGCMCPDCSWIPECNGMTP